MSLDYSIQCTEGNALTTQYSNLKLYATINIFICKQPPARAHPGTPAPHIHCDVSVSDPLGIPALFSVLLWKHREALGLDDSTATEEQLDARPQSLRFLYGEYECKYFWWEIVECGRRLLFSGALVLFGDKSLIQIVFAVLMCLVSIKIYSYFAPFREDGDDFIAEVAQYQLFLILFVALIIRLESTVVDNDEQGTLDLMLVGLVCISPVLFVVLCVKELWTMDGDKIKDKAKNLEHIARDVRKHDQKGTRKSSGIVKSREHSIDFLGDETDNDDDADTDTYSEDDTHKRTPKQVELTIVDEQHMVGSPRPSRSRTLSFQSAPFSDRAASPSPRPLPRWCHEAEEGPGLGDYICTS